MTYTYTNQKQVRAAFWEQFPEFEIEARDRGTLSKRQNEQTVDTRCAFVDFVDALARNGDISEALANRVTL
jgi:hypothetical protein